ncbi:MAG: nicotinate-nucleotide adenylyltransferase [Candidatus Eisenbacteria bacterium]|nr:nicotinate-nucleotide adenylyltransferase [Candidatus Eisenbacteria bacterium]
MRVGLFGGTFDPIHIGHLIAAEEARERAGLDRVIFVPCGIPPHKRPKRVSAGPVRLEMTRLAVRGNPGFEVSEFEVSRDEASFTVETVRHFKSELGGRAELFLIVGADSLLEMHAWKNPAELLSETRPIVVSRPGFDLGKVEARLRERALVVDGVSVGVSSTDIRARVASGRSIRYLVPPSVLSYIVENKLYTSDSSA